MGCHESLRFRAPPIEYVRKINCKCEGDCNGVAQQAFLAQKSCRSEALAVYRRRDSGGGRQQGMEGTDKILIPLAGIPAVLHSKKAFDTNPFI